MAAYTEKDIAALIGCAKRVSEAPKKGLKLVDGALRNDLTLVGDGTEGSFSVFMRKNEDFPENFSIGLMYRPMDDRGEIILVRCNGPHGVYNDGVGTPDHPHWGFHIHMASEAAIDSGERPEKYAKGTEAYASFEEAVDYFMELVNLDKKDRAKHFPPKNQTWMLFDETEEWSN